MRWNPEFNRPAGPGYGWLRYDWTITAWRRIFSKRSIIHINWPSVVHHWAAPGSEYTVTAPVSCNEGNTGPLWRDVDPGLLHLLPLMDSMSPLQVCMSLIKRCLCASCLPSARFIIMVSEWEKKRCGGKSDQPSRFTNLWSSFHEWGGPRCSSCWTHGCLFAKGALAVCPCWLVAPCPCTPPFATPYTYH